MFTPVDPAKLALAKAAYEKGDTLKRIYEKTRVSQSAVAKYAKREGWRRPQKVALEVAKELAIQGEDPARAREITLQAYEEEQERIKRIASRALKQYEAAQEKNEKIPKDLAEVEKAAALLRAAYGIQDDTGPQIGINIALLSSPG